MKKAISILSLIAVMLLSGTTKAQNTKEKIITNDGSIVIKEYIYGTDKNSIDDNEVICVYYENFNKYTLQAFARKRGTLDTYDYLIIDLGNKEESIKVLEEICCIDKSRYIKAAIVDIQHKDYTIASDRLGLITSIEKDYNEFILRFDVENIEKIIANIKKHN
ncbi:MAG: hypothetical protein HUK18_05535 [Bacteroidales bacterium]|nr:hypothetical protein [Bacteroidales bacterium]